MTMIKILAAFYPSNMPSKMAIITADGSKFIADITPVRKLTMADLEPCDSMVFDVSVAHSNAVWQHVLSWYGFELEPEYISIGEYAAKHGRNPDNIRQRILRGNLPAVKIGRNWCIRSDTPLVDKRTKSKDPSPADD